MLLKPHSSKPIEGVSIGKLPQKHTTKHVARQVLPPGSINAKGQQKILDPSTGKVRWVDRKKGSVLSASGVPVRAQGVPDQKSSRRSG